MTSWTPILRHCVLILWLFYCWVKIITQPLSSSGRSFLRTHERKFWTNQLCWPQDQIFLTPSIDSVKIIIGLYFLLFSGNRVVSNYMTFGEHFIQNTPCSLLKATHRVLDYSIFKSLVVPYPKNFTSWPSSQVPTIFTCLSNHSNSNSE